MPDLRLGETMVRLQSDILYEGHHGFPAASHQLIKVLHRKDQVESCDHVVNG